MSFLSLIVNSFRTCSRKVISENMPLQHSNEEAYHYPNAVFCEPKSEGGDFDSSMLSSHCAKCNKDVQGFDIYMMKGQPFCSRKCRGE